MARKAKDFAVAYLNVLIDDADQEELTAALGRIARLSGGERLVEKVELNAQSLYRTLCRRGNPELRSVATLLKAMGIRLTLQPLAGRDAKGKAGHTDRAGHADRVTRADRSRARRADGYTSCETFTGQ
jgi:probable addiction module antidote protein